MTWTQEMDLLCQSAQRLARFNVIDVSFTNGEIYESYVAASMSERHQGLSGVSALGADGMLFVYEVPSFVPFTMSDMLIDLDVAWFSRSGEVIKRGTFEAGSTQPLVSPQAFSYVYECPAGTLTQSTLKVRV